MTSGARVSCADHDHRAIVDHAGRARDPGAIFPRPRLLDRVRDAIRTRHYSRATERACVGWIKRYIFFHGKRHPQALNALLFLYRAVLEQELPGLDDVVRAKRPQRLPVVLTRDEVRAMLDRLEDTPRLMALLLAKALGLTIPPSLLQRADQVIE